MPDHDSDEGRRHNSSNEFRWYDLPLAAAVMYLALNQPEPGISLDDVLNLPTPTPIASEVTRFPRSGVVERQYMTPEDVPDIKLAAVSVPFE